MLNVLQANNKVFNLKASSPIKISISKGRAFSLPAGPEFSCPGATKACVDCYAQKGRHNFETVQSVMAVNWKIFSFYESNEDKDQLVAEILSILPKDGFFRIHESGDFHSQFSIDTWSQVISERPDLYFYAYTRSFMFDYSAILQNKNFTLWASTDKFNEKEAVKFVVKNKQSGVKHAFGPLLLSDAKPENSFYCPVTTGKIQMEGGCEACKLCIVPNRTSKNVIFVKH